MLRNTKSKSVGSLFLNYEMFVGKKQKYESMQYNQQMYVWKIVL